MAAEDQAPAAIQVVTSGRVVDVLVGPAGTGKTTSMAGVRAMWETQHGPGSVIGLAPSAIAAQVLASDLGIATDNTAQWLAQQHQQPAREQRIVELTAIRDRVAAPAGHSPRRWALAHSASGGRQLVAAAGATADRGRGWHGRHVQMTALAEQAKAAGAKLLLVGDPHQLSPVDTGGAFTLLAGSRLDIPTLTVVRRFTDPDAGRRIWEEQAAGRLRVGDPTAGHTYQRHDRIHAGDTHQTTDAAYTAWLTDTRCGKASVLIAANNDQVRDLNERARAELVQPAPWTTGTPSSCGTACKSAVGTGSSPAASTATSPTAQAAKSRHPLGGVRAERATLARRPRPPRRRPHSAAARPHQHPEPIPITLPPAYVREHVELGYAVTAHRAQGLTVDTAHVLADSRTTREAFYVARPAAGTPTTPTSPSTTPRAHREDVHDLASEPDQHTPGEVLAAIAANTTAEPSARQAICVEQDRAASIATLAAEADTIATHAHHIASTALLLDVLGDTPAVRRVIAADDYPQVVAAVRGVRAAGLDAPAAVRTIGGRSQVSRALTARALADAITRTAAIVGTPARPRLVAGLIPDATRGLTDPQTLRALRERYQLIEQRADALLDSDIAANASWLRAIPRHPIDSQGWRSTARLVAAFRDRWGITGTQPLGPPPDGTAPHAHHADQRRAINALALHNSARGFGNQVPVSVTRATSPRSRSPTTIPTARE